MTHTLFRLFLFSFLIGLSFFFAFDLSELFLIHSHTDDFDHRARKRKTQGMKKTGGKRKGDEETRRKRKQSEERLLIFQKDRVMYFVFG
jgi:hypothetical protein